MNTNIEFVPIDSPRFVTLAFDTTRPDEPFDLDGSHVGSYLRVRYTATEEDARTVDHDQIRSALLAAGAASVKIEPTIIRPARARAETISEDLTPLQALTAYCDANNIDAERAEQMLNKLNEWVEE